MRVFFVYLKSGMSDLMDEEADYLENYVLYAGIRGLSMWKKPFVRRLKNKEEDMNKGTAYFAGTFYERN